jgi:protease I
MSTKNVLMVVGDFSEDYEVMVAYQALEMVGHDVDVACPGRAAGDSIKTAIHDFRGDQTYVETRGHDFELTAALNDLTPDEYDVLLLPGGRAPEYLRTRDVVIETVRHFFDAEKPVGAICHGPQILAAAGVLDGYELTSLPDVRTDVERAGAGCTWVDEVTRDRNLVTGQTWDDLSEWLAELLDLLGTDVSHGEPIAASD